MDIDLLSHKLFAKLWSARIALWAERFLSAFHPLLWWVAIFICAALFEIRHDVLSVIFWVGAIFLIYIGIKAFHAPQTAEIQARVERDSKILHRPLRSLQDEPSTRLSQDGIALWAGEQARKLSQFKLFGWVLPRFNLVQRDPYALRIAMILLLLVGATIAGRSAPERLQDAFFPFLPNIEASKTAALKIVITPPSYTRKPQISLTGKPDTPVEIPEGSTVRVLAQSWLGHISLQIGDVDTKLQQEGETDAYSAETKISETSSIKVKQFGIVPRLTIPVTYIKDTPPSISLTGQPEVSMNGQLRLPLTIQDDYGLKLVRVRAILSQTEKSRPLGAEVFEEQSVVVISDGTAVEISPRFDLTGHPWAGYAVSLLIEGEDFAGQTATAEPVEMSLPERPFRNAVAREIIAARKVLIRTGEAAAGVVALKIAEVLSRPGRYQWDTTATLALRSSLSRLGYDPTRASAESVIGTLWPTALRLEDGNLTTTQTDLRKALENLQRAMQESKSPEEIAQLMQDFRDALARHLAALQKEIQKKVANGEMTPMNADLMGQVLDMSMLNDFLDQLANEMANGDIDGAMKKLEDLQKMSDMLDPSLAQPMPEDVKQKMESLKDLQKVIDAQQALLDKTRSKKNKQSQAEKGTQDKIGDELGVMKSKAEQAGGEVPGSIGKAGDAMGKSSSELAGNNPGGSVPHQQEALDQMRQGRKEMQKSLQQRMQQMMGLTFGPSQQPSGDPLGRSSKGENGRDMFKDTVEIPNGAERKKADEILKTIRERSSDLARPQAEREYYQRLLRQW